MKILHLGSSGMIGSRVLAEAISRGHDVVATSRHPEKILKSPRVTPYALNAGNADDIIALITKTKAEVLISSVSPRSTNDPRAEALSYATAIITAAKKTGRRVVVVGGAGSLTGADGNEIANSLPDTVRPEALAMCAVRDALRDSPIDWTVICPPAQIAPGEHTGTHRLGGTSLLVDGEGKSQISAEDFAHALLDEVEQGQKKNTYFTVAY